MITVERSITVSHGKEVAIRNDGLQVFLDGKEDPELDRIRLEVQDKRVVILAVALRRFQQIALNYTRMYAPDVYADIQKAVSQPEISGVGNLPLLLDQKI